MRQYTMKMLSFSKKLNFPFFIFMAFIFTMSTAFAKQSYPKAEALINKTFHNKAIVIRTFQAPENLIGFVVKGQDNESSVIYVDKDGDYLFLGTLVNSRGKDITAEAQSKYIDNSPAAKAFHAAQNTDWFEQGNPNAPHQIYVIAEPNCSACHYFYESVKPYIANGQLKIRWIMVAFLRSSSLGKAAAIMSAKNPAQAFEENEERFNAAAESGGITPLTSISPKLKNSIEDNLRFMNSNGFRTTPIILFRNTSNKISVLQGALPKNEIARLISVIGKY